MFCLNFNAGEIFDGRFSMNLCHTHEIWDFVDDELKQKWKQGFECDDCKVSASQDMYLYYIITKSLLEIIGKSISPINKWALLSHVMLRLLVINRF